MSLQEVLKKRMGDEMIIPLRNPLHPEQALLLILISKPVPMYVLSTASLSSYEMPVLSKWAGREHNELCFVLPSFWDVDDINNPSYSWVYEWLWKLERFVKERNTWFGPGHTFPCDSPRVGISERADLNHFIFLDPILLKEELAPVSLQEYQVQFLCIVPIYHDELDFKFSMGTEKFIKRFVKRKNDEKIEQYRKSIMESRMRFFS